MLLLDNLLGAPFRGLLFVFGEIANAVDAEREAQHRQLIAGLSELHRMLDEGRMTPDEFDAREAALLDRLAAVGP